MRFKNSDKFDNLFLEEVIYVPFLYTALPKTNDIYRRCPILKNCFLTVQILFWNTQYRHSKSSHVRLQYLHMYTSNVDHNCIIYKGISQSEQSLSSLSSSSSSLRLRVLFIVFWMKWILFSNSICLCLSFAGSGAFCDTWKRATLRLIHEYLDKKICYKSALMWFSNKQFWITITAETFLSRTTDGTLKLMSISCNRIFKYRCFTCKMFLHTLSIQRM